ncbi:MAG: hypothetical protein AAFY56_03950 [Pseudomonadota bacterium]
MKSGLIVAASVLTLAMVCLPIQGYAQAPSGKIIIFDGAGVEQERPDILRGSSAPRRPASADRVETQIITSGATLWSLEPGKDRLTACRIRNTSSVNRARIQCAERGLD